MLGFISILRGAAASPIKTGTEVGEEADNILDEVRKLLGPPPRRALRFWQKSYLRLSAPQWLRGRPKDELWEIYRRQDLLWKEGEVVWGAWVQANKLLLSPGPHDSPATAIYSWDGRIDDRIGALLDIATRLGRLKGAEVANAGERRYGRMLADEHDRAMALPVPATVASPWNMTSTTVMVCRKHLPRGILAGRFFPLLTHPKTAATVIVPSRFWPDGFRGVWEAHAPAAPRTTAPRRNGLFALCPYCDRNVLYFLYSVHIVKHATVQARRTKDGRVVLPGDERYAGSLHGVPRLYRHPACGSWSNLAEDVIRSYLVNPFLHGDRWGCRGCKRFVPTAELYFAQTGECVFAYMQRLRGVPAATRQAAESDGVMVAAADQGPDSTSQRLAKLLWRYDKAQDRKLHCSDACAILPCRRRFVGQNSGNEIVAQESPHTGYGGSAESLRLLQNHVFQG